MARATRAAPLALLALLVLASGGAAPPTVAGDYVEVFGQGTLVVRPPAGAPLVDVAPEVACHVVGGCTTRVDIPPGTEASGVWRVTFLPADVDVSVFTTICYAYVPVIDQCYMYGPWPDPSVGVPTGFPVSFRLAGWTGGQGQPCLAGVPSAWLLDHAGRTITGMCGVAL